MEPEANAFKRCFALISLLDIFHLPEVIFLEAVNHHSNQVGRFICLLLCQCTSVNCPAVKRLLIGKLQMKHLLCTVLLSHSLEICQLYRRNTHQHQRVSKQKIPIIIPILTRRPFVFLLCIGFYLNWFPCQYIDAIFSFWGIIHIVARWQKFCTSYECCKIS